LLRVATNPRCVPLPAGESADAASSVHMQLTPMLAECQVIWNDENCLAPHIVLRTILRQLSGGADNDDPDGDEWRDDTGTPAGRSVRGL
jgi:hypothetical protein